MLVDSHCHLDRVKLANETTPDLKALLANAHAAGVGHMLSVCIHPNNFPTLLAMATQSDKLSISVGLHPTESIKHEPEVTQWVALAKHPRVVALGETGLDYYREYDRTSQHTRFRRHIRAAKCVGKPLIVHTRHAPADTLALLEEEGAAEVGGVLHCFTEQLDLAKQAMEKHNFYVSFSGILTFKNSHELREIAKQLPLDRLLIETDAPYLAPVPFRGKPNQPAYVRYVAETLASLHGLSIDQIATQTTENFFRLFKNAMPPL